MDKVDSIKDYNDLIIEIEAQLVKNKLNKDLLIREAFILWYVLVEGEQYEYFSEDQLSTLLHQNYLKYKNSFQDFEDYNFIIGWMINVAFWIIDESVDESYGNELLLKAYNNNRSNSLFKWAVRTDLRLSNSEILHLQKNIAENFYQYYNYGPMIKDYFLRMIQVKL